MFTNEQRQKVISTLDEKIGKDGRHTRCPMCGGEKFALGEGYFSPIVQDSPGTIKLAGKTLPTTYIICKQCGFISQHALGVLGLLELTKTTPPEEKTTPPSPSATKEGGTL